jgi:hypothetical protein
MNISLQEAIEIHAKALRVSHGRKAENYARERAAACKRQDDREGDDVWNKVADTVVQIERDLIVITK